MRRLSATLLATTILSLAAMHPSAAASPKAVGDDNCAIAKGEAGMSVKARLDVSDSTFWDLVPVYRVDRIHLMPRAEVAMHRHGRPQPAASTPLADPTVSVVAAKAKTPLRYSDNAKDQLALRADLRGGLEVPVAPVVTGPLLSAYA